jgi:hypothetical protein
MQGQAIRRPVSTIEADAGFISFSCEFLKGPMERMALDVPNYSSKFFDPIADGFGLL